LAPPTPARVRVSAEAMRGMKQMKERDKATTTFFKLMVELPGVL
jgi:hypothetical protein